MDFDSTSTHNGSEALPHDSTAAHPGDSHENPKSTDFSAPNNHEIQPEVVPASWHPVVAEPVQPSAPSEPTELSSATPTAPVAVVRVLSPVGVEYVFLTICLFAAAVGLTWALLALVNGKVDFQVMAFPAALLLVTVPAFAVIFLHLKKLELRQPALTLDPSKRRSTQFTQITSFFISLFTLVGVVFSIFAKLGGQAGVSVGKILLDGLVLLVVFGGILAYYWRDEHRG